ncbi:hypothetical protein Peur_037266 [Populus x canadensis]
MEKVSFSMTFLFVLFVITTCKCSFSFLLFYIYPTIYFIKKTNKIVLAGVSMSNIPVVEGGEIKLNLPCDTTATCEKKSSCPGERMVLRCVHNFCQCNW